MIEADTVTGDPHHAEAERLRAAQQGWLAASRAVAAGSPLERVLGLALAGAFPQDREVRAFVLLGDDGHVVASAPGGDPSCPDEVRRLAAQVRDTGAPAAAPTDGRPSLAVPLHDAGGPIGSLVVSTADPDGFDDDDRLLVDSAAALVAAALVARRRAKEQLELDRLRSDFVARVSHELRTPLTIISGFTGTLAAHDETLTAEQRHELLDRIMTAAIRLEHLVDDLLSGASVEAGARSPAPVEVPVRDLIDVVVRDQGGGSRVEVRCPSTLRLVTDPALARQTLAPVLENALQHGDRVRVAAGATPGGVRVEVVDDGPGVPDHLGERIFDRFVRGQDETPGLGLGLAVARSLGDTIGGRLELVPSDTGARFVLHLPDLDA